MKKIRIKFCPKCGSENIAMTAGGITGMYGCLNCDFKSTIFPEKEVEIKGRKKNERKK